jgi:pyruvate dehydrogenase E1 component alpha subunit
VIQNNQWAISVPLSQQTASQTLAQKAHAYGIPGLQVDGNDVFAVHVAMTEALERARSGGGPTLLECVTYRIGDHTTADDASRYRSDAEVAAWKERDPILRLRRFMESNGSWDENRENMLADEVQKWVDTTVEAFEQMAPADPVDIFRSMYAEMTPLLAEQAAALQQEVDG